MYALDERVIPKEANVIAQKVLEKVLREAEAGTPEAVMIIADSLMEACQENRKLRELLDFDT